VQISGSRLPWDRGASVTSTDQIVGNGSSVRRPLDRAVSSRRPLPGGADGVGDVSASRRVGHDTPAVLAALAGGAARPAPKRLWIGVVVLVGVGLGLAAAS